MGLQRRRRLFRAGLHAGRLFGLAVRGTLVIGLGGALVIGAMALLPRPARLLGSESGVPGRAVPLRAAGPDSAASRPAGADLAFSGPAASGFADSDPALSAHPVSPGHLPTAPASADGGAHSVSADASRVAVVDGATLRLRDTVVVLTGIAAPARGRSCPDGTGGRYDCGAAAAAALAGLVGGRAVSCRIGGRESPALQEGACEAGGVDLSHAVVATGWARALPEAVTPARVRDGGVPPRAGLTAIEVQARAMKRGLWRNGAEPGF